MAKKLKDKGGRKDEIPCTGQPWGTGCRRAEFLEDVCRRQDGSGHCVGLQEGKSVDDFAVDFTQALSGLSADDSVLVLADIVGGSPLTTAASVLADMGKLDSAVILGGLNLTMGLTGLVMKDILDGKELAQAILSEATAALQEFEVVSDAADEDEDDI